MAIKLRKSVRGYLSKIKSANSNLHFSSTSFSSTSKSWILKGCKHVKTLSFSGAAAVDHRRRHVRDEAEGNKQPAAATLADVDQFLFDNFRSLYIRDDDDDDEPRQLGNRRRSPSQFDPPTNRSITRPVVASSSGSVADELPRRLSLTTDDVAGSSSTTSDDADDDVAMPDDCIALLTYSKAPQDDFCRSMREMVESRIQDERSVDWEFMEELLFGYLNLNDKKSHKFILSAFVDLVVGLRTPPSAPAGRARRQRGNPRSDDVSS